MQPTQNHAKPAYVVVVDGRDITPSIDARLIELTLTEARGDEADMLELTLSDHDGALALPRKGAVIAFQLGYESTGMVDKGTFVVDEVEHSGAPDTLSIRARAADLRAALRNRKDQSWHEQTLGTIFTTLAKRNSITPRIATDLASKAIDHIDQTNESDIAFATRLARRYDATATVKAGCLLCLPKGSSTTASGAPLPRITITRASGDSHRYTAADRDQYTGVRAYWHDGKKANRKGFVIGTKVNLKTLKETYASEANAKEAAQAEWLRIQRGLASMSISLAMGNPSLTPQTLVTVQGFKEQMNSTAWRAVAVRSSLNDSGFTQTVDLEIGEPPAQTDGESGAAEG
jgi:phage protein D